MLSEDTQRLMGDVEHDVIAGRVRHLYELWAQGDVDSMIACFAPDVTIPAVGFWTGLKAPLSGREQVSENFRRAAEALENVVSVLHETLIDGDRVVVHRTAVGRRRADGRRYQCDFIDFFRFRDGLLVEFSEYPDAAWSQMEG